MHVVTFLHITACESHLSCEWVTCSLLWLQL